MPKKSKKTVKRPLSLVAKVKRLTKDLRTIQRGGGIFHNMWNAL